MMKLALCVQTDEVPVRVPVALFTGPFAERASKAGRLGVAGLELMTTNPSALSVDSIRTALDQNHLEAAAIGSGAIAFATGLTLMHPDPVLASEARRLLRDLIDFAAAIGAPLVTVGSFRGHLAPTGPAGRERLAEVLSDGAAYAGERGVRLALEAVNRYELDFVKTAEEGLAFLKEVNHPALGLLLDTFHMNIEERSWTEPFCQAQAVGRLYHVHLGDNNRLPPGQGHIDFPTIVRTLRASGYDGYLSAELLSAPDPDAAARLTVTHMTHLLKEPAACV